MPGNSFYPLHNKWTTPNTSIQMRIYGKHIRRQQQKKNCRWRKKQQKSCQYLCILIYMRHLLVCRKFPWKLGSISQLINFILFIFCKLFEICLIQEVWEEANMWVKQRFYRRISCRHARQITKDVYECWSFIFLRLRMWFFVGCQFFWLIYYSLMFWD